MLNYNKEVIDHDSRNISQTIAAKGKTVGSRAQPSIAQVERLLADIRGSRIAVGHGHFTQGKTIQDVAASVREIV